MLNLLEYKGKFITDDYGVQHLVAPPREKFAHQLDGLAETISRADPDILFLQEVESVDAISLLVKKRLDDRFRILMLKGNDARGIDIAVLVKKDLPFDLELQSYRNQTMRNEKKGGAEELVFSRDLPVLTVKKAGSNEPAAVFMGTHFKSQRDSANDPRGAYKRGEQAKAVVKIFRDVRRERANAPVFLLGDFNSDVPVSPEFQPLWDAGFRDSFDTALHPPKDKVTHTYHPTAVPFGAQHKSRKA